MRKRRKQKKGSLLKTAKEAGELIKLALEIAALVVTIIGMIRTL